MPRKVQDLAKKKRGVKSMKSTRNHVQDLLDKKKRKATIENEIITYKHVNEQQTAVVASCIVQGIHQVDHVQYLLLKCQKQNHTKAKTVIIHSKNSLT